MATEAKEVSVPIDEDAETKSHGSHAAAVRCRGVDSAGTPASKPPTSDTGTTGVRDARRPKTALRLSDSGPERPAKPGVAELPSVVCGTPTLLRVKLHDAITWPTGQLRPPVKPGDPVQKYDFEFFWTTSHLTGLQLAPYRFMGDDLADKVLDNVRIQPGQDSLAVVQAIADDPTHVGNAAASAFMAQVTQRPPWLDEAKLRRGQQVFVRYCMGSLSMLFYFSLVGGFGAPRINKVLTSTGYLNNKHTYRRLHETTQMITDCLEAGSLDVGGVGWKSCLRVRFLHAQVRQRLLKMKMWRKEEWGIPVNQEDMCATQLSFSFNVLLGLEHLGVPLSTRDKDDYTHMWRYMGYILGIVPEMNPCTSFHRCKAYMESLFMHLVEPDESSVRLAHNALNSITNRPPAYMPFAMNAQLSRMILGDAMADKLKLPPTSLPLYLCHRIGFQVFVRFPAWLSRQPVIGPAVMAHNLRLAHNVVALGLGGDRTDFRMSHPPKQVLHGDEAPPLTNSDHRGPPPSSMLTRFRVINTIYLVVALYISYRLGRGAWWLARLLLRRLLGRG